jgi:hypothetical protein
VVHVRLSSLGLRRPGDGVDVGWRAICGISLSWMISGRRGRRRRGRGTC